MWCLPGWSNGGVTPPGSWRCSRLTTRTRNMPKPGMVASLFLALAGCATAPGYRAPAVPVPAAFRETRDTVVKTPTDGMAVADTITWPQIGDSTLVRLMKEAVRANLDVRAAEARVRGSRSARTEAVLDFAPTVTFAGGPTRPRIARASFPGGGGPFPGQNIWDGGFDASWELDLFGRVRRNVQAQSAFVAVNLEDLRNVRVSLSAEVARAYFELRGAQEQLAVATKNASNQRRTLEVTRQRLEAGRGTAFDTERAQAQLSFTRASIPTLEALVRQAQYKFGVWVGRPPAALAAELDATAALPSLPDAISVETPDSVIRRRPDVMAAERQLAVER